jgi:hypothetical protein
MKKYSTFLLEAQLTHSDAVKILGLKPGYSPDDLSSTYKLMAKLHHPDKGGDVEQMKQINAAYNLLKGSPSGDDEQKSWDKYQARKKRDTENLTDILEVFTKKYQPGIFKAYFEDIYGISFKMETSSHIGMYGANVKSKYFSEDRGTVIDIEFYMSVNSTNGDAKLGPDEHSGVGMTISRTIFHNRRRIKLAQQNYSFESDYRVLSQPEKLFPKDKMVDKSKNAGNLKFKKADAILTIKNELGARWDGTQWMRIPLNDKYTLVIYRLTSMGIGTWGTSGIYEGNRRVSNGPFLLLVENQKIIYWFVEQVKGRLQKDIDLAHIQKVLIDMGAEYKELIKNL